jgi:hypothetical protein
MPDITDPRDEAPGSLAARLLWFFAIAIGSALAVGLVAEGLRFLILH